MILKNESTILIQDNNSMKQFAKPHSLDIDQLLN